MLRSAIGGFRPSRSGLPVILMAVIICLAMVYRIGSAPPGLSRDSKRYVSSAQSINQIYRSPDNAPHKLLVLAESESLKPRLTYLRTVSVFFGLAAAACFYVLCRNWFGRPVALMSLAGFCLAPFFLTAGRQASPEVLRFAPLIILSIYYWHARTDKKDMGWILLLLAAGAALYIPGMFWWLAAAMIISRRQLLTTAGRITQPAAAAGLLLLILAVVPLILAFIRDRHFVYRYLLIPSAVPAPLDFLRHLGWMILSLFARTPYHDQQLIGRLPLLSLIQLALVVFGAYALFSVARKKAAWLAASVIFGLLLAALNNDVRILLFCLPALGITMAAGLRYLYIEWRSVFPKNPIPKSFALVLLAALVAVQAVYGLTYSLIAWPASQDTKAVYVLK